DVPDPNFVTGREDLLRLYFPNLNIFGELHDRAISVLISITFDWEFLISSFIHLSTSTCFRSQAGATAQASAAGSRCSLGANSLKRPKFFRRCKKVTPMEVQEPGCCGSGRRRPSRVHGHVSIKNVPGPSASWVEEGK